jgi:hypothetical protein
MLWYDVKPIHEALGTDKMDSSVELELTDDEYASYKACENVFFAWNRFLDRKIKSQNDDRTG